MSNVIDWSKYGRGPKRETPKWKVTYSGNATKDGITVTAIFPLECFDEVAKSIKEQIEFWKRHP